MVYPNDVGVPIWVGTGVVLGRQDHDAVAWVIYERNRSTVAASIRKVATIVGSFSSQKSPIESLHVPLDHHDVRQRTERYQPKCVCHLPFDNIVGVARQAVSGLGREDFFCFLRGRVTFGPRSFPAFRRIGSRLICFPIPTTNFPLWIKPFASAVFKLSL